MKYVVMDDSQCLQGVFDDIKSAELFCANFNTKHYDNSRYPVECPHCTVTPFSEHNDIENQYQNEIWYAYSVKYFVYDKDKMVFIMGDEIYYENRVYTKNLGEMVDYYGIFIFYSRNKIDDHCSIYQDCIRAFCKWLQDHNLDYEVRFADRDFVDGLEDTTYFDYMIEDGE